MLENQSPVVQALLGTLFTWGLTFLGAAMAIFIEGHQRKLLDISLGFAAGVMLAASYWSLLEPALEMAAGMGSYGERGEWAFIPVSIGVFLGAGFVYSADLLISSLGISSPVDLVDIKKQDSESACPPAPGQESLNLSNGLHTDSQVRQRYKPQPPEDPMLCLNTQTNLQHQSQAASWRRILLLIVAVTIHNIPEGLAVGVGFGAVGKSKSATFSSARNLAIGIGIQNFPEGVAVSLPLKASGFSTMRAVWYGQLSGLVEPLAGVLGAALVSFIVPILPYALAFAAGAMIYVVVDDIVPECQAAGNGKAGSWGAIIGFIVMMSLDVALG